MLALLYHLAVSVLVLRKRVIVFGEMVKLGAVAAIPPSEMDLRSSEPSWSDPQSKRRPRFSVEVISWVASRGSRVVWRMNSLELWKLAERLRLVRSSGRQLAAEFT